MRIRSLISALAVIACLAAAASAGPTAANFAFAYEYDLTVHPAKTIEVPGFPGKIAIIGFDGWRFDAEKDTLQIMYTGLPWNAEIHRSYRHVGARYALKAGQECTYRFIGGRALTVYWESRQVDVWSHIVLKVRGLDVRPVARHPKYR
jgi:hypothetical protein